MVVEIEVVVCCFWRRLRMFRKCLDEWLLEESRRGDCLAGWCRKVEEEEEVYG